MADQGTETQPFKIRNTLRNPLRRAALSIFQPAIERALAFPTLNEIYTEIAELEDDRHFSQKALDVLGIDFDATEHDMAHIPATGPLVVVANHPFGGLEGLILASLLMRVRPDVKLLANYMLSLIPDLRDRFFFVDPFGHADSAQRNIGSIKASIRWVHDGGVLGVFPAGEVSSVHIRKRRILDPNWSRTIARIVRKTHAAVLPVYFAGANRWRFQMAGMVHPRLRSAMLPRELLHKRRSTVSVSIGNVIPFDTLSRFETDDELTSYLRVRTYILRGRDKKQRRLFRFFHPHQPARDDQPIAVPRPLEQIVDEVAMLPAEQRLVDSGQYSVFYCTAPQIPNLLHEIGRLRELAFRDVGEGTGKELDLDEFDQYYVHLFVWNHDQHEIVGAYRLGPTDKILPEHGKKGLYTSTLFEMDSRLLDQINPALEMGRSFVRPEYQRNHSPLSLLWRGIGHFMAAHPRYRMIFGPVSISNEYNSMSKQLLVRFLKANEYVKDLARLIKPRHPPRLGRIRDWDPRLLSTIVRNIDEVDDLISDIEADRRSVPVLLRQYLKLNAKLLGFNVDPEFGDVLDGLILIDVPMINRGILVRYFGRENAERFRAYHGVPFDGVRDGD
ncbi:MAG: glycerol acyltransferase [Planctomycetaceae bacterium]|nr:glycerol acyltransferase [Planctomycetaceae bacterium]